MPSVPSPSRHAFMRAAGAVVALSLVASATAWSGSSAALPQSAGGETARAAAVVGVFGATAPGGQVDTRKGRPSEVGMRFSPRVPGTAVGLRSFKAWRGLKATPTRGSLWAADGTRLAMVRFAPTRDQGWVSATFRKPVALAAGSTYTVSAFMAGGKFAQTIGGFETAKSTRYLSAPGDVNGVVRRTSRTKVAPTTPTRRDTNNWVDIRFSPDGTKTTPPPPPPPPATQWPGPDNTGVPAGVTLQPYGGPCTIREPMTLSGVDAKSTCDALFIRSRDVVIEKSLVPLIEATEGGESSVTLTDTTVDSGQWVGGSVWGSNISATRIDVSGGQHSVQCVDNCSIVDSWLHDQWNPDGEGAHNNAFISNGGTNMTIRHNTLHCTAILNDTDGGCTADLSLFGDFDTISHVTVDNNLFRANNSSISYCAYAGYSPNKPYPNAHHIVFTNNVFERGPNRKCGVFGPITGFQSSAEGNVWEGNVWDDSGKVPPVTG